MGPAQRVTVVALMGLVGLVGCGGGGGSGSAAPSGRLNLRALWQQPAGAGAAAGGDATSQPAAQTGGFGPQIPAAVQTVRVIFQSPTLHCCIAFDPRSSFFASQRLLVLDQLPPGSATVMISGFAGDAAPIEGTDETCQTDPAGVGQSCDDQPATPSFQSGAQAVGIQAGRQSDAGDILISAVPFLLGLNPVPNASAVAPVPIAFTAAIAKVQGAQPVACNSLLAAITQTNTNSLVLTTTPCDDANLQQPCSPNGALDVAGCQAFTPPQSLQAGAATLAIRVAGTLNFSYPFAVLPGGTAPAGTLTPTPTATPVITPIGVVIGSAVDCLTGGPIAGASVTLDPTNLPAVLTAQDGSFQFDVLPFGDYTVRSSKAGFIDSSTAVTLTAAAPQQDVRVVMCPQSTGLRVVLTWGSAAPAPADLDAHLRGPAPGTSVGGAPVEFNLYTLNTPITFSDQSTATLDIDSVNFAGPETETASSLVQGTYHFCVHDFSDRLLPGSSGLANSQARVQVFLGNAQVGDFQVPSGNGTVWAVFDLDNTSLTQGAQVVDVNTLSDESDLNKVCRRPNDTDGDGLTDDQEIVLGTDLNVFDTNGDFVSDGQDVINGVDPRLPTPTPSTTPFIASTFTETPAETPTTTPTATATPSLPPGVVSIEVGSASGDPGATVVFSVTLHSGSEQVGGTLNDISFDSTNIDFSTPGSPNSPNCRDLNQGHAASFIFRPPGCAGVSCTTIRAALVSSAVPPIPPIPDGTTLYGCAATISAAAPLGTYLLTISNVQSSDTSGTELSTTGTNGSIFVGATPTPTATPTAAATPNGGFLCSAGSADGSPCNTDNDCPGGVCVIAQGVCDGGGDDGSSCDCAGSSCGTLPACGTDAALGTCSAGPAAGSCCDPAFNCADGAACTGTPKVCLAGTNKGSLCLRDAQCPGSQCVSTGRICNGGDFDGFACVDVADCPGGGTCIGLQPSPTATPTPSATPSPTSGTQAGSILVFENLQVSAASDPTLSLTNASPSFSISAYCFYADTTQPTCKTLGFNLQLNAGASMQWQASTGAGSVPGTGTPFSGELVCVEVDFAGPVDRMDLTGSLQSGAQPAVPAVTVEAVPGAVDQDDVLMLNGTEYEACPAGIPASRIEGCWSQSQFTFLCSIPPTATPTPTLAGMPTPTPTPASVSGAGNASAYVPGALLVYPYVTIDSANGVDTVVQLSNTSVFPVSVHCFYENTTAHCNNQPNTACTNDADCPAGGTCTPGWSEQDFILALAGRQPTSWRVSQGSGSLSVPAAAEDPFVGLLRCVVVDNLNAPIGNNAIKGEATIETFVLDTHLDVAKYNALALPALTTGNGDQTLTLGDQTGEYAGCPQTVILNGFFDGAADPVLQGSDITTTLALVPCSVNYSTVQPSTVTVKYQVFNEFEQSFTAGNGAFRAQQVSSLADISRIFSASVAGTLTGQAQIVGMEGGVLGVAIETHRGDLSSSAGLNTYGTGLRFLQSDTVVLP